MQQVSYRALHPAGDQILGKIYHTPRLSQKLNLAPKLDLNMLVTSWNLTLYSLPVQERWWQAHVTNTQRIQKDRAIVHQEFRRAEVLPILLDIPASPLQPPHHFTSLEHRKTNKFETWADARRDTPRFSLFHVGPPPFPKEVSVAVSVLLSLKENVFQSEVR